MPPSTRLLAALLPCAGAAAQAVPAPAAPPSLTFDAATLTTTPAPAASGDLAEPDAPGSQWQAFRGAHGDFMDQRERHQPMAQLRFQYLPHAGISGRSGTFDLAHLIADLDVPLAVSTDTCVNVGGLFELRDYRANDLGGFPDTKLYATAARL